MRSDEYWRKREEETLKHYIKDEQEYDKEIKRIYTDMLDATQKEIDSFYAKYASKEGITIADAKKRVSKLDIAAYERKAERYVKAAQRDRERHGKTDKNAFYFSERANEEMRLYNLTMKVNRLEMLKANIGLELLKGHAELETFLGDVLKGRTMEELERQAGILGKSVVNNAKRADAIVNGSFHNATFSDRLWMHHDMMKADLSKLLQSGMIQGKSPIQLARDLRKYYIGDEKLKNGKSGVIYNTERLMRTELARVQTEAQRQSFVRNGFEMYTFHANSGCCKHCQDLNGKHFKVSEMMPGENAPPVHPNCRCSTSAYEDSADYHAWLDYLAKGGTTEQWNKLKKGIVKSGKSSRMESKNMSNVNTGGKRNEEPLTDAQITEAMTYAALQGYKGEIHYSDHSNTSFHGSTEGEEYCYLVIGTDAYPTSNNNGTANERISVNGCMAHEVVGHYETWKKGTVNKVEVLDEAQASIRAAKFGVDLSDDERQTLLQDAYDRLEAAGIAFEDVKDELDIWER